MNHNQIIVSIIFSNNSSDISQIFSLELNILDTLNTKLVKEVRKIDTFKTLIFNQNLNFSLILIHTVPLKFHLQYFQM
jgi:hypothetical protein